MDAEQPTFDDALLDAIEAFHASMSRPGQVMTYTKTIQAIADHFQMTFADAHAAFDALSRRRDAKP